MKRIRNIKDLEFEKLKLRVKQLELERQMERSWKKLSFEGPVQRNAPTQSNSHFKTGNRFLNLALDYGSDFLTHKLGMLAGKKIEGLTGHVLEKLSTKLNMAFSKGKKRSF